MEETEMAVVISQEQNEIQAFKKWGLDILPHREKMEKRELDREFKDSSSNFRIVFVCAMWLTGFDVKSLSCLYLDKPLKALVEATDFKKLSLLQDAANAMCETLEIKKMFQTYAVELNRLMKYANRDDVDQETRAYKDAIIAIYRGALTTMNDTRRSSLNITPNRTEQP